MRNFRKDIITNKKNRSFKKFKPTGVVLHETATVGAPAANEVRAFNTHDWGYCVHGFIDWTEDVQTLPWDEKGWHAKEPANSMFIGIEMCRPKEDAKKHKRMMDTYNASVDAVARLFHWVLNVDIVTKENLMSHDEVRIKWSRTTHTDPTSYLTSIGKNMDIFRKDVQEKLDMLRR